MSLKKIKNSLLVTIIITMLLIAMPGSAVFAAIAISIAPESTGTVGTLITVTGTGFTATQTFTTTFGTTTEPGGTVGAGGTLTTTFEVPSYPRGARTVTVTTAADGSATANFTITPSITLDTTSGSVGDQVDVSGTGFNASSTITIYFDGNSVTSAITDANGSFHNATMTIPRANHGDHTITARDATGYAPGVTYTILIEVTASQTTAAVGSRVTLTGKGFAANSSITLYMDGTAVSLSLATTNNAGGFIGAFTVPTAARGEHTLEVIDNNGNSATTKLTIAPSITLNPPTGSSGISVSVTGNGFTAGETITIRYNGNTVNTSPAAVTTDSSGGFRASFTTPGGISGSYVVEASDGTYSATTNFATVSNAAINPNKGSVATVISVKGTGFSSRGTVSIEFDENQVAKVTADDTGAFSATFNVPHSPGGNHLVTVTDGINKTSSGFVIVANASLSPNSGYVGSDVVVNGTGFAHGTTITIKYDANQVATTTSDANGSFSNTFKAPVSKGGNHTVTVTDGVNTATSVFAMDSTSPPVPALSSPADGAGQSITGGIKPTFRWAAVTDQSNITYILQVDTSPDFSSPILEKSDITGNRYTLTASEALPYGKYYWRVRAIDGASNVSAWSQAFLLKSGLMPLWALLVAIMAIVVAAAVALYLLLSRQRARRWEAVPVPQSEMPPGYSRSVAIS